MATQNDTSAIARALPDLIAAISDIKAGQAETTTVLRHMADELKQIKHDRVQEDLKLAERLAEADKKASDRLTALENQFHASRQAPWSLLLSAVGIAVTVASLSAGLVYFVVASQVENVSGRMDTQYVRTMDDIKRVETLTRSHATLEGHPQSVIEKVDALGQKLETQINNQGKDTDRITNEISTMRERMREYDKRTGTLFKDGKPY